MKFRRSGACWIAAVLCVILFYGGVGNAASASVYVRWVDDGDTIVLEDGRRIRYIGINAPEIGHDDIPPQPLGVEAKNFNKKQVLYRYVRLEFDREKTDQYGRTLAYIFNLAGAFINREILSNGYGHYLYRYPNVQYDALLLEAQRSAMKAGKGIWFGWNEKKDRYVGHRGSRRFHLASCPMARKIRRDKRIYFTKKWDALWQGYAPAKNCLGAGLSP